MQRLSSCYFCGVALDESLSEYPVVPRHLDPDEDDQRTVVLCSSCRRKLATILDTVDSAAQADGPAESAAAADTADLDESGLDAQPDPMALSDANETVAEDYPDRDILDRVDADEADESSAEATASDERDDRVDSDDRTTDEVKSDEKAGHDEGRSDETGHGEGRSDQTDREPTSEDGTGEERANEPETEEPDPALTRLEYSKVMRLLQNRPFPVEKAEMRQVAVHAYDIDPEQFDAITDLAVERDLIAEEDGQFVSPE